MIIVFDTETTGKAEFKMPLDHPRQPHIVQLGAQVLDENYKVRGELNLIVRPDGWSIPKEASDIHGITDEIATRYGAPIGHVMAAFTALFQHSNIEPVFVAHNFPFDSLMMNVEQNRIGKRGGYFGSTDQWFCTMAATTPICKIEGSYGFKWPKLQEAYRHAFNEDFEGAHDAMADVRACARLFQWIKSQEAK